MYSKIIALIMAIMTFFSTLSGAVFGSRNKNVGTDSLVKPDTWAATDALGRTLPMKGDVRKKNSRKFVGMFYWIWHTNFADSFEALDASEILAEHPEILYDYDSPLWRSAKNGRPYYWGKPLYGYYRDTDAYVLRKHAELIADAGVDVIIFDCTNSTATWDESYEALFEVFEQAKADGVNVPQVAFMLPFAANSDTVTSLKNLYERIYSPGRYKDLWFMWDGKPLIMAHGAALDTTDELQREISEFFTFRRNEATYFASDTKYKQKVWGWCSDHPQTKFGQSWNGRVEEMCVSVAQNAADGALTAMNADGNVQGRSFAKDDYSYSYESGGKTVTVDQNTENALLYGLNFQQQWDYVLDVDPDFVFVTGWNEWIAGRWQEWCGTPNAFPDQFSAEFSRDIEPHDGVLKDNYYYQLVANIRRFKGVSDSVKAVDGVKTYYHYTDSTYPRSSAGWQRTTYASDTMRNDFVKVQVKNDKNYIYMTIQTKDPIVPQGSTPIRVLLDTDPSGKSPNWEGFEYVLNRDGAAGGTVTVERSVGGWQFEKTGEAVCTVSGNEMALEIPLAALGLSGDVHFNFKLSDNMQTDGDIMDFYKSGDVAPGGRFMFVY